MVDGQGRDFLDKSPNQISITVTSELRERVSPWLVFAILSISRLTREPVTAVSTLFYDLQHSPPGLLHLFPAWSWSCQAWSLAVNLRLLRGQNLSEWKAAVPEMAASCDSPALEYDTVVWCGILGIKWQSDSAGGLSTPQGQAVTLFLGHLPLIHSWL